jgi:hypothetical protein
MYLCSLSLPANDGWQEIVNQPASHRRGWPTISLPLPPPPPVNPNAQATHVASPVQSSHISKRLKTNIPQLVLDKGKAVTSPSSPSIDSSKSVSSRLHLKDDYSHVISAIHPKESNQPGAISENSKGDNNEKIKYASQNNNYGF